MRPTFHAPRRSILLTLSGVLSLAASVAVAQDPGAGGAEATTDETERVQIGAVYEQPIYLDMIQPPAAAIERYGSSKSEAELEQWLLTQRTRILSGYLIDRLSNAYKRENGIAVSEQEINDFIKREKRAYVETILGIQAEIEQLRAQAEQITARGGVVTDDHMREIILREKKIENMERKNVDNLVISERQRQLYDDMQRRRVAKALGAWKFNRMLHEQFGGRVVVQDLSYHPFEAYADWLEIEEQLGRFEITDETLRDAFWNQVRATPAGPMEPFDGMWDQLRWYGSGMP